MNGNHIETSQNETSEQENSDDRELLLAMRRNRLQEVDALERRLGIAPRTAELREEKKKEKKADLTN